MVKKLPKQLSVRWEYESDEPFLVANAKLEDHAEMNSKCSVGIYKLIEVVEVEGIAVHRTVEQ